MLAVIRVWGKVVVERIRKRGWRVDRRMTRRTQEEGTTNGGR